MSDSGYVKMHRGWMDNPVLADDKFSKAQAFQWLIEQAFWTPGTLEKNGFQISLSRGDLCFSIREMAEIWGWSKSSVDRFITSLVNAKMIEKKSGTESGTLPGTLENKKFGTPPLVLTICNYNKYQSSESHTGTLGKESLGTCPGTHSGTPTLYKNNLYNNTPPIVPPKGEDPPPDLEKKKPKPKKQGRERKPKIPLPEDLFDDGKLRDYALEHGFDERGFQREKFKFRNHYLGPDCKTPTRSDWAATWRNWLANCREFVPEPKPKTDLKSIEPGHWRSMIRVWREHSHWHESWGPKPGEPDCKAPPEILEEFGLGKHPQLSLVVNA